VTPGVMWANLHLLFWLSLIPAVTGWLGTSGSAPWPTALYGIVLLCAAVAYTVLERVILAHHGPQSALAQALGRDVKGKISIVCYAAAIAVAFVEPKLSDALYVVVALLWLVPDVRVLEGRVE
jgi:uncharacterized membrane protein